jgi:hypothetical protein
MVTQIVYDTEFIDDGSTIAPISIAMRRVHDGAELYAINDDLVTIARAAEHHWLRDNVLRWLPLDIEISMKYEHLDAHVSWNIDHPEYGCVKPLDEIREMVEDFVLAKADPQLWAYYASYDHVLYAQLYGPMSELPDGMPMYTMDIKQEAVMRGNPRLPSLDIEVVNKRFDGVRKEHHALYDVLEETQRLEWLLRRERV